MPGYEDVYFTSGSLKDASEFKDTQQKLGRWVASSIWKHVLVLARAMTELFKSDERSEGTNCSNTGATCAALLRQRRKQDKGEGGEGSDELPGHGRH
jgi:hypothetical protein